MDAGTCYFTFEELCGPFSDRSGACYRALCASFHTIAVDGVPILTASSAEEDPSGLGGHNAARRFITLVDQCYERNVRLAVTAAERPERLFNADAAHTAATSEISFEDSIDGSGNYADVSDPGAESSLPGARTPGDIALHVSPLLDPSHTPVATQASQLASVKELEFAFRRASSRLVEMGSAPYLTRWRSRIQGESRSTREQ
jgi:predicted ATPase